MTKQELIQQLEEQLSSLKEEGEYEVKAFNVFYLPEKTKLSIEEDLVRVEAGTHEWGSCRSETCQHMSHDPWQTGDTLFIKCKQIKGGRQKKIFETKGGVVFLYLDNLKENGFHYAPTRSITIL